VRFFLLRTHYRSALNYSDMHLDDAHAGLKRLYTALNLAAPALAGDVDWTNSYALRFKAAMDEDFGTPEAISVLFDLASEINRTQSSALAALLKQLGACLGLLEQEPEAFLQAGAALSEHAILALINERAAAKANKDFVRSDEIRKSLLAQGVVLKDSAQGTTWEAIR
jgi:cysteinyl-tRNA synthetase